MTERFIHSIESCGGIDCDGEYYSESNSSYLDPSVGGSNSCIRDDSSSGSSNSIDSEICIREDDDYGVESESNSD